MASAKDSRGPGFPLAPFFTTLIPLGVRVTVDDYRRIGTALAASGRPVRVGGAMAFLMITAMILAVGPALLR